jgi:hypothetical protein
MKRVTAGQAHVQAMLAAALVAAEVRDEAEEGVGTLRYKNDYYLTGWYEAANKIAQRLSDLAQGEKANGSSSNDGEGEAGSERRRSQEGREPARAVHRRPKKKVPR